MSATAGPESSGPLRVDARRRLDDRSAIYDIRYAGAWSFPEHAHRRSCITLVLSGSFVERYRGELRRAEAGAVLCYRSGSSHSGRIGGDGASVFQLELAAAPRGSEPVAGAGSAHAAAGLLRELYWESRDGTGDGLVLSSLAAELSGIVERPLAEPEPDPSWLGRVLELLRREPKARRSLADLAREARLHPSHFAREFRRRTGTSAGDYARRLRVAAAASLLARTRRPLAEIALDLGYADQSHLGRQFKRFTGMTPRAYREAGAPVLLRH